MHSADLTQDNIMKIREIFPGCVSETKDENGKSRYCVDFNQLRQELSEHLEGGGGGERYHLNWPGKRQALLTANTPITKTLRPCRKESVNFDATQNLFIEGDNLEALKLLQETYLGKVKMIYIDPPYNTGNDFIYHDNFASDQHTQEIAVGEKTEEGIRLVSNPEGNGRFHSNWLTMIFPRLRLAKNLLTQDGAIFVSCDEGEQPRLRMMMDEIFGQSNFIADMVWAAGRKNNSRFISVSHEYIVCYVRDLEYLREKKVIWRQHKKGLDDIYAQHNLLKNQYGSDYREITKEMKKWYKSLPDGHPSKYHKQYAHADARGVYFPADLSSPGSGGPKYEVLHPKTKKPVKIPSRGWIAGNPKRMQELIDDDRIHFGDDEKSVPCFKSYLKDGEFQVPYSVFYQDGRAASKRLRALMGGDLFDFPKDELVLQEIIEMVTEDSDIVLDFFAGSSTTAHSVMLQNAIDGGNRKFFLVQIPEATKEKSNARRAGFSDIAEISKERIRRAGMQIFDNSCHANWRKDIGFRVLKVDTSNMAEIFYTPNKTKQGELLSVVNNIKEDRDNPEDLLFQVFVDWGVDLTLPIHSKTIQGKTVFFVNKKPYDLIACFDSGITEKLVKELAKHKPLRVVFLDNGFASDAVKINVWQIFLQTSPNTEVKSI